MSVPDVIANGRCAHCAAKHQGRTPKLLVNVNFGPGDSVQIYWHDRVGGLRADAIGATSRHRATPVLTDTAGTKRHRCSSCGLPVDVKQSRLVALAREAASGAVNGRCTFFL